MKKPNGYWNNEALIREAVAPYASRTEFARANATAYKACNKYFPNLIAELFPEVIKHTHSNEHFKTMAKKAVANRFIWTEELIRTEALRHDSKSEFKEANAAAYKAARKLGIIDELGFTNKTTASTNDTVYIWRALGQFYNGERVYKIGSTSSSKGARRIKHVARISGFDYEVVSLVKVNGQATRLEAELRCLGENPLYTGFNGCTEFRALSASALDVALSIICARSSVG